MIASAHIAAGVLSGMVGSRIAKRPAVQAGAALAIGFATHIMLDAIPHADYGALGPRPVARLIVLETLLVGLAALMILRTRVQPGWWLPMLAGVLGAAIPDVGFAAQLLLPGPMGVRVDNAGDAFHGGFHARGVGRRLGITTQLLATVASLGVMFAFPKRAASPQS